VPYKDRAKQAQAQRRSDEKAGRWVLHVKLDAEALVWLEAIVAHDGTRKAAITQALLDRAQKLGITPADPPKRRPR
jgi:hypothetical protein